MDDLTGQTIGRRTVMGRALKTDRRTYWIVKCSCGSIGKCRADGIHRPCHKCGRAKEQPKLRLRPFEARYNAWTKRAKKRYPVILTYEQFLILTEVNTCHYCTAPICWSEYLNKTKAGRQHGSNLDRKDSSKGYEVENVVVCCWRCNCGKSNLFTYDEWLQLAKVIRSWKVSGTGEPSKQT